jgi:nicotinate-nucleotide adenylyltransferase
LNERRGIGLFGGTFDPVHNGHLRVAVDAREGLGLDQVRLLPCRLPPHRAPPQAGPEERLALLELALAGQPDLVADGRELEREGPSYTYDTLAGLRTEFGATRPLLLLLGGDAFIELPGWHRWRELTDLAHVVVLQRPGAHPEFDREVARHEQLTGLAAGHVLFWSVTQLEISSSRIRALLAAGQSARYLLPDAVLAEIERRGLYRRAAY